MDVSEHSHEHEHTHPHTHEHTHAEQVVTQEERAALLHYMLVHNQQHLEELRGLQGQENTKAQSYLSAALSCYEKGNENLAHYVEALETE